MELTPEILGRLEQLEEKYSSMGQDMPAYLDGLLYSNFLTYWDYVHLDTLLSLQTPRTDMPDEQVFIIYHQITELYFKLVKHELVQLTHEHAHEAAEWKKRLRRSINYFKNLAQSFDVMIDGMEQQQFLKFRMALLPASGFQSAQYREIELMSAPVFQLVKSDVRDDLSPDSPLDELYECIYWKYGNIVLKTGEKTLTLQMFERRYDARFKELARDYKELNLCALYRSSGREIREDKEIIELLREYDLWANVFWRLSHYKSAVRYLHRDPDVIAATGGTNWQKYLPPNFQRIVFFPELWSEEEKAEWGKAWVMSLFRDKVESSWG